MLAALVRGRLRRKGAQRFHLIIIIKSFDLDKLIDKKTPQTQDLAAKTRVNV